MILIEAPRNNRRKPYSSEVIISWLRSKCIACFLNQRHLYLFSYHEARPDFIRKVTSATAAFSRFFFGTCPLLVQFLPFLCPDSIILSSKFKQFACLAKKLNKPKLYYLNKSRNMVWVTGNDGQESVNIFSLNKIRMSMSMSM